MSDCINCAYYDDENAFCTYSSIWKEITITVKDCPKYKRTDWKNKRKEHTLSNTEYFKESYNEPYKEEGK